MAVEREENLDKSPPGYVFEQFRVERGCLGYVVADPETRRAAIVDPEAEMVEPMLDFVFEHGLKPLYVVDTHTHADHLSGARELRKKTVAKIVMTTRRRRRARWTCASRTGTGSGWAGSP